MKTPMLVATAAFLVISSSFAFALASADKAAIDKWAGSGTSYTPQGAALSTYQLNVENTELAPQVIQSVATAVGSDGTTKVINQKITTTANHFKTDSNLGQGGGSCYGADLCESYIAGQNGVAYATTIIVDGPNDQRHITVILKDGKAIKILRDKVSRLQ